MENIINPVESPIIVDKLKTNYLNLFLISLAFVLFITGAYLLGKQSTIVPISTPVGVLPKVTPVSTIVVNPTTNLKTYTNNNLGFQINYSSNYNIAPAGVGGMVDESTAKNIGEHLGITSGTIADFYIDVKPFAGTLDQYIVRGSPNYTSPDYTVGKLFNKTINNSTPITIYKGEVDGQITYTAFFKVGNLGFTISTISQDDKLNEFSKILSTFKFTENKAESIIKSIKGGLGGSDNIIVSIKKQDSNFAIGDFSDSTIEGYGGRWTAKLINNTWKLIESGPFIPTCEITNKNNFPKSIVSECVDLPSNENNPGWINR